LEGNHWGLEDYVVVWRQGELVLAREEESGDIDINFKRPTFSVPPEPEVVNHKVGTIQASMGSLPSQVSEPELVNQVPYQGMPLSHASDSDSLIHPELTALVPEELLRSQGNDADRI
jgi:hypothetical protein